eukprot:63943_1
MRLLHLTNYRGHKIVPNKSIKDEDTDLELIWVQAVPGYDDECCPGFGDEIVNISQKVFKHWDRDEWVLWKVAEHRGKNPDHYFYKFILVPKGYAGLGKKTLLNKGWKDMLTIDPNNEFYSQLEAHLSQYWYDNSDDTNHVHIGIYTSGQAYYVNN